MKTQGTTKTNPTGLGASDKFVKASDIIKSGLDGSKSPDLTISAQCFISLDENSEGSIPYFLHPPTPSATPTKKLIKIHVIIHLFIPATCVFLCLAIKHASSPNTP